MSTRNALNWAELWGSRATLSCAWDDPHEPGILDSPCLHRRMFAVIPAALAVDVPHAQPKPSWPGLNWSSPVMTWGRESVFSTVGISASHEAHMHSTPWSCVVLPSVSVLKTLRTSRLHDCRNARPRDARRRLNRADRTPAPFKRLPWQLSDGDNRVKLGHDGIGCSKRCPIPTGLISSLAMLRASAALPASQYVGDRFSAASQSKNYCANARGDGR